MLYITEVIMIRFPSHSQGLRVAGAFVLAGHVGCLCWRAGDWCVCRFGAEDCPGHRATYPEEVVTSYALMPPDTGELDGDQEFIRWVPVSWGRVDDAVRIFSDGTVRCRFSRIVITRE